MKDLCQDLLDETKGLKYQMTLKVELKKYNSDGEIEFTSVYFNSATKTVINHKFGLEKTFQEISYRIDNWINEGSGWIVEAIKSQYINISTYRPLWGSSCLKLPTKWRSPKKGRINIFLWCHLRHINSIKVYPERITQKDKELANDLDYNGIELPVQKEDFSKIQTKNNMCINILCYENKLIFPIYISDQKFENSMDLLLIINENKSHYIYIKDFYRFMFHKTKNKNKKSFCKSCLQFFSSINVLTEHKEVCLSINGAQSVRFEKGTIGFKIVLNKYKVHINFMLILSVI